MEAKFYTLPGRLQKCIKSDIILQSGQFIENTLFFIKHSETLEFYGTYKILCANSSYTDNETLKTKDYYNKEINYLIKNNLIYKLISVDTNAELIFKMYIRTADEFDLFEGGNSLSMNTIYYTFSSSYKNENAIQGPFYINQFTNADNIKEKIAAGSIFIPYKKQKFEPIQIQKIA